LIIYSCKKDDDFTGGGNNPTQSMIDQQFAQNNFGGSITSNFIGRIVNENGGALKGVQITIGNSITVTDHNGVFVLNNANVYEKFAYVKVSKVGYINGSRVVVPTTNGTNDIQITLLKKNTIATISSGTASEVSLPNGSKVVFQGDFIDSNGNPYTGQVDVSMHYLQPNQKATFTQMPGMLFAQDVNNNARSLETYGMLGVDLYSPNGEQLNIAEASPASLTFPVDISTPNAPETIALWYFDETVGYWKEQGIAIKVGNEYVAEVTHFTWWNCDLPLEYINACFTIDTSSGINITNNKIEIVRNSTNQIIFSGYTNDIGQECGLLPKDEEMTVKVYSECSNAIFFTEAKGPFSSDTSFNINVTTLPSDIGTTVITGNLTNCAGNPITNGYALLSSDAENNFSNYEIISIFNGTINYPFTHCNDDIYKLIVFDLDTNQRTEAITLSLTPFSTNLNTIATCQQIGGTYVGNVPLRSQEEVNNFGLLGYEQIEGDLIIEPYLPWGNNTSDITNLLSLSGLMSISGGLNLVNNFHLESLDGLHNLISIGNLHGVTIRGNHSLINLSGLESLTSVGRVTIDNNNSLLSLTGLENLNSSFVLVITNNQSLISLDHIGLTSVVPLLSIKNNDSLTSLGGLENISTISTDLRITENESLSSLTGLENLTSIGGDMIFSFNPSLGSFFGMDNLTSVGSTLLIMYNESLASFSGIDNLTSVGSTLTIQNNQSLVTLQGLNSLTTIGLHFNIISNDSLTTFSGLTNLLSIGEFLNISSNDSLTSLIGMNSITSISGILIGENTALNSILALENITSTGDLYLGKNDVLTSLEGINNITNITGTLTLKSINTFTDLQGFEGLTNIDGSLIITDSNSFTSLQGLSNLTSIGGTLAISNCSSLSNLNGLENLTSCIGTTNIGMISDYTPAPNPNLSDFCALTNLFTNGTYSNVNIVNNQYNPTVANIQAGNCSN